MTTTRHQTAQCAPGNRVRILTSDKEVDPNTYEVVKFDRQLAILKNLNTDKEIKVHKSRIVHNLDTAQENNTVSDTATNTPKTKAKRKAPKRVKLNVKDLANAFGSGCEHYVKKIDTFDHENIDTRAHVLILPDHRSFVTFNTYDGSLGRKIQEEQIQAIVDAASNGDVQRPLKAYPLPDDAAFTKKVEQLKKDAYAKRPL